MWVNAISFLPTRKVRKRLSKQGNGDWNFFRSVRTIGKRVAWSTIVGRRSESIWPASVTILFGLIVIIVTTLNKPISHPTIKSFVYLNIDFSRDKGHSLPDESGHVPQALSRSLRATTLARPCGTIGRKRCTDVPMNAACAPRRGFQT